MRPLLFLDVDRTIFDTARMKAELILQLIEVMGSAQAVEEFFALERSLRGHEQYLHLCINRFVDTHPTVNVSVLKKIFFATDYSSYVYSDVRETIERIASVVEIQIFSTGDFDFQMAKIRHSSVLACVSEINIFDDKLQHMSLLRESVANRKVWYIDDSVDHLVAAKQASVAIHTIWCRRENQTHPQQVSVDVVCQDFNTLLEYIHSTA